MTHHTKKGVSNYSRAAWVMISPFLLFFIITLLIPTLISLYFSFASIGEQIQFVGLENYISVFRDPLFAKAYLNTFIFMAGSIPVTVFLALILAVLLNQPHIHGRGFFRTVYYLPAVTSVVAVASVFLTFYNPQGLFNRIVTMMGAKPINWLTDPFWSQISIIIVMVWLNVGFYTVMFLAGLQNISSEVYESAEIDGASKIRQFFSITIPLLKPVVLLAMILSTINGLGAFEAPNILFQNSYGPENAAVTVGVNLYKTSFELVNFGKASAIAWTMVIVAVGLSLGQFILGGRKHAK
ncbi:carbohydrate ABC transporter permease [Lacticaseibacillus daqingensis]|uniref:carbohydrate ABC transporter permease n=1 Tax=Lacticaseibacillus daqingensis TaxID=2486014 RepID=UPI000F7A3E0C|nr:sugar ABC transporter permease [Lacticaseibacillus daqingensis]